MRKVRWMAAIAVVLFATACGQTDAGITTAVKGKLAVDDEVKAYQIDVDTRNKIVTLSGSVNSAVAKTRAVELARATDGVTNVVDNLRVTPDVAGDPLTSPVERAMFSDSALTSAVKAKLLADTTVSGLKIDVDTENQIVSLTGEVRTEAEKEQALKLARETEGVKSVNDRLTIKR
jgi:hyperosmotically inducible periplasmic protein